MRVIAGTAGGLTLQPPGKGTRPTMDRVRAAIFSSLGDLVPGARVLDLFAGSGALGIEALSRGASSAVFVEHHGPTASVIRKNLQLTKLEGSVQQMDAYRFLDLYGSDSFDLIFADPPYLKESTTPATLRGAAAQEPENLADKLLTHSGMKAAAASSLVVLECERRQPLPSLADWDVLSDRTYGESRILLLRLP
jgi:16S rRNA (guanine966-N2)-methyltransferase